MKRTKILFGIFLVSIIFGCVNIPASKSVSDSNPNSDSNLHTWLEYELPPSMLKFTGEIFMQAELSDGSVCSVFQDDDLVHEAYFYHDMLLQDFGWHKSEDKWIGDDYSRNYKNGSIYINLQSQIAIYFDLSDEFGIFRVSIENNSLVTESPIQQK
jgi:hypothetical protein